MSKTKLEPLHRSEVPLKLPTLTHDEPIRLQALLLTGLLDSATEDRFDRITRLAQRALDMPIVAVSLVDAGRQWFKSIQGLNVCETSRDVSFCGHTINQDDVFLVEDASKDERFHDNPLVTGVPNIAFYAGYPVRTPDGSQVGTLCAIDRKPRHFDEDHIQTLRDLALMVEREICFGFQDSVQSELLSQLSSAERHAMVDPLTRLWNRDGLDFKSRSMIAKCLADGDPMSIMMIDIDCFKQINDSFGHQTGDEVIQEVARRLQNHLRDCDVIGRFGGDEFLIAMNRTKTTADTLEIAERILRKMAENPIVVDSYPIEVTLSIGVAFAQKVKGTGVDELIKLADDALYHSKSDGRNAVNLVTVENDSHDSTGKPSAA